MRGNRVKLGVVPLGAWIFASVALVAVLGSFVILSVTGSDSSQVRWVILALLNGAGILTGVSGTVYAGAAAKNAQDTKEQTNGMLDAERTAIAEAAAQQAVAAYIARKGE